MASAGTTRHRAQNAGRHRRHAVSHTHTATAVCDDGNAVPSDEPDSTTRCVSGPNTPGQLAGPACANWWYGPATGNTMYMAQQVRNANSVAVSARENRSMRRDRYSHSASV